MKTYLEAEGIELVNSGTDYFDVLERMIHESEHTIHLQTYIFEYDETGKRVVQALKKAVQRGVKVCVLIDAYGSYPVSREMPKELLQGGVHFRLFSPLFSSESIFLGRRLHHKIVVADKRIALTGGINIADKYKGNSQSKAWLDYAVLTRGSVCEYLHLLCEEFYHKKRSPALGSWERARSGQKKDQTTRRIRYRRNDWIRRRNEIHKSYVEALLRAERSIVIVASYFLPGQKFRKLLQKAAARGVDIKIILAGKSDISSLHLAENYLYEFYLRHGIQIYEWTNSVMHGKAMMTDKNWVTIGSYNLNFLSHYISIELNTEVLDPHFISGFAEHLDEVLRNNCRVAELKKPGHLANPFRRMKMWLAYTFYRWLMNGMMTGRKYRKRKK